MVTVNMAYSLSVRGPSARTLGRPDNRAVKTNDSGRDTSSAMGAEQLADARAFIAVARLDVVVGAPVGPAFLTFAVALVQAPAVHDPLRRLIRDRHLDLDLLVAHFITS